MKASKSHAFTAWSYENTLGILANRFPDRVICLCKPSHLYSNSFACYDALVDRTNARGDPAYTSSLKSLTSLSRCLDRLSREHQVPSGIEEISVVGFSKGCIVLNQILYEIHTASQDERIALFLSKCKEFYWLDSGHNGTAGIWICDRKLLESFAQLKPSVYVGVTPYQMKSVTKPWAAKEKLRFVEGLRKAGVMEIEDVEHFFDKPPSLENHFRILNHF